MDILARYNRLHPNSNFQSRRDCVSRLSLWYAVILRRTVGVKRWSDTCSSGSAPQAGVEKVAHRIADEVEAEYCEGQNDPRKKHHPPCDTDKVSGFS